MARPVVPEGFPQVLKEFTREVLRQLPTDLPEDEVEKWVYSFGSSYFGGRAGGSSGRLFDIAGPLSPDELRDKIVSIFLEADEDRNGYLDHREFKKVVTSFSKELGLAATDVRRIMAEADENEDGVIEYSEFVPLAVDVIDTLNAKRRFEAEKAAREEAAVAESRYFLLHGLSQEELENVLQDMFRRADVNGDGFLSRAEFTAALKGADLGLTRKEINILMAEADENEDGKISYDEFLPLAFNLLVEIVGQDFENEAIPRDEKEVKDFFMALFSGADPDGTGFLRPHELSELMRGADLGLTSVQLQAVMAEAVEDDEGLVFYEQFASSAASIIAKIIEVQTDEEKAMQVMEYRQGDEYQTVLGMKWEEFCQAVTDVVQPVDPDGSGRVPVDVARSVLVDELGIDDRAAVAILRGSVPGDDGKVDTMSVADLAFRTLQQIKMNEALSAW